MNHTETIKRLHAMYQQLTGWDLPLSLGRMFTWERWIFMGWREPELQLVIEFIKQRIKEQRRRTESLRFENLVRDTERFSEDLAEARALARRPKPTPRQAALASIGKREPEPATCKTPGQVMAESKAFEAFRAWRKENGI